MYIYLPQLNKSIRAKEKEEKVLVEKIKRKREKGNIKKSSPAKKEVKEEEEEKIVKVEQREIALAPKGHSNLGGTATVRVPSGAQSLRSLTSK